MQENAKNKKLSDSLQLLIECISTPALVVDDEERIVGANKAIEKYFKHPVTQQIGKKLGELDIFSEETKLKLQKNDNERVSGKSFPPSEITLKSADRDLCLEVKCNRIVDEGQTYDLLLFHDSAEQFKNQENRKEELLAGEEKFHNIIDSIREAIILVDEQAQVTYWNPAAEKIFGYTSEEVIGKKVHDMVAPKKVLKDTKDRIDTSVKLFTETGTGYFTYGNVQLEGKRKNSSEFPVELSISPLKLNGKWNAVGVVKDISDRKFFENKLRDAEQRYHALFNQAPIGVLVVDVETASFVEFNDVAHLQLGYTREEFEELTVFDIQARDAPEVVKAHIKELLQQGGGEFEVDHKTKTGETRHVSITIKVFHTAGKPYFHCIFHDITENKKAQNARIESEARYRQLVEVAQEGIWAIDSKFNTTLVNPYVARMLGYKEKDMIGKSLFDFIDMNMVAPIRHILEEFSRKDIKRQYEYAFPTKDGTHVDTTVTLSRITDKNGRSAGTLAIVTDITERKRMEKALKESEELSRAIVANAPIGIATCDGDYRFLTANEAFCNILGYTEQEFKKLTFKDFTHPDDLAVNTQKSLELRRGDTQSFVQEKRYIRKDGSIIIGRVIVNSLRDPAGKPLLSIVELEDITKRKRLEDDLRASEEKFRAISSSAADAIILSDTKDNVIYWNPAAEKMLGFTEKEAVGNKLSKLTIPPEGHLRYELLLKELCQNPVSRKHFNLNAIRKNGSKFPVDLSVISIKLNDKPCLLSIIKDISEWKAMEETLRQERDMLESVTSSTNILLSIVDRDYRIIWANQTAKGSPHGSKIEGRYCYEIFANGNTKNCEGCGVKKIYENGAAIARRDYYTKRANGDHFWAELISTPIKDKQGNIVAALEIAVDITERKQLQDKLAMYSQRLEEVVHKRTEQLKETQAELMKAERLAAIGELAGMVGHDLRNPLTGIKNSAYILKRKGKEISEQQYREMLETINKCVDYSNRIVNDLLDYSREIHLELSDETLDRIFEESLAISSIPETIVVENRLQKHLTVNLDFDKMKRVFINLIKNSIEAMPNGGKIMVESVEANGEIEVSFTDTGMGISDDLLPKLFAPLCTTKAQGMGFGLAICKRIIEAHGGKISVKTSIGKGTKFTLTLPLVQKIQEGGEKVWINMPESSLSMTTKQSEQR